MKLPLTKNKLWLLFPAAFAFVAVLRLFAQGDHLNDFGADLSIHFPKNFTAVVDLKKFQEALNASAVDFAFDSALKTYSVYYDGTELKGGVDIKEPTADPAAKMASPAAVPAAGSHVTQYVSFADIQKLDDFVKAIKPTPSPTPTPKS